MGKKKKILYHDLDHLSGAWTKEDSTMFENVEKKKREFTAPHKTSISIKDIMNKRRAVNPLIQKD